MRIGKKFIQKRMNYEKKQKSENFMYFSTEIIKIRKLEEIHKILRFEFQCL